MKIKEFVSKVKKGEIDVFENTKKVLASLKDIDKEHFYMMHICEDLALDQAKKIKNKPVGRLAGVPVTLKDCICVKGVPSTSGSKILSGYKPTFNATAVQKLIDEGAIIIGKTSQDEFGFGALNTNTGIGIKAPLHPLDKTRVCGGSSGGSAGITKKADFVHVSLAESTGGSIVCPASFCGVVGFCPTYGRVSRYGLIDYGSSLDKIGTMALTVEDAALVLEIISGYDENESTSSDKRVEPFSEYVDTDLKNLKVGLIMDGFGDGVDEPIKKAVQKVIDSLKKNKVKIEEVNLPLTSKYSLSCYYLLAMTEASTNLAKYCGIRYGATTDLKGSFNEFFSKVRSQNMGDEAKRRIIIGTFARMAGHRDAYYLRSTKIRTKIIEEYKRLFKKYDVLISPTMPIVAPKFDDVKKLSPLQNFMMDILIAGPNLAGMPHITLDVADERSLPIGLLIIADHFNESKLVKVASNIEKIVGR